MKIPKIAGGQGAALLCGDRLVADASFRRH
jgi:hypothetical protein